MKAHHILNMFLNMNEIEKIRENLLLHVTLIQEAAKRFFKTAEGNYGAGDVFLGITVPNLRKIAKIYKDIELLVIRRVASVKI